MTRALIDTNIILDALASREPFRADAENICMLAAEEKIQCFVTANSATDIYYLVRKNTSEATARDALRNLFHLFSVADVTGEDCTAALDSSVGEYEDALVAVCAARLGVDCIVTRDQDFLRAQTVCPVVDPARFLALVQGRYT